MRSRYGTARFDSTTVRGPRRLWRACVIAGAALAWAAGCGAPSNEPDNVGTAEPLNGATTQRKLLVELFSWWTAPGEAEAFQRLVDAHKSSAPDARLFNAAAASGVQAQEILKQRLAHNDVPDLFQENLHDLKLYVLQNPGKLMPLDATFDELHLRSVIFPEVLTDLTIGGHLYSMPVNVHRENTLIYNKKLFAQHGVTLPATLDELRLACAAFKSKGVTPIATSHQGWILRIMFNSIAAAHMGVRRYYEHATNRISPEDASLRESVRIFGELLFNYANSDAGEEGFGWMNAAQAVMSGDAAMYIHGDWAKGYLAQLGAVPEVDFGTSAAPGTKRLFLYTVDVFAVPRQAPNVEGAMAFLRTIASSNAQAAFNRIKGSSPIRSDLPVENLDLSGKATLKDLEQAEIRMSLRLGDGWDDAMARYAKNRDEEALYQILVTNRPIQ